MPPKLALKQLSGMEHVAARICGPVCDSTLSVVHKVCLGNDGDVKLQYNFDTNLIRENLLLHDKKKNHYDIDEGLMNLKGILYSVTGYHFENKNSNSNARVFDCPYFSLLYYPPTHFLALARKSKPAIHITYPSEYLLNANVTSATASIHERLGVFKSNEMKARLLEVGGLLQSRGSLVPKDWSYLRVKIRKELRRSFLSEWCNLRGPEAVMAKIYLPKGIEVVPDISSLVISDILDSKGRPKEGVSKDGVYHYKIKIFPDCHTNDNFVDEVKCSVRHVANLNWDKLLIDKGARNWVDNANSNLNLSKLNRDLSKLEIPYKYHLIEHN
ncbi:Pet130p Ecym_4736 [Eremothecium cymbalariae DBVPG|uniref:Uncharacterized protein n=1 Tax=Eremothecium cymbalariae (strain CBS 270.75 / DBVPG 7215 / KCTC 17166 / NRRL Y-17582) TaxID=931890 RepID=G8JSN1_ERECY|nr:hypothetical protein Ecym_4736 [Eremothecium cymbalariae DBVPG\